MADPVLAVLWDMDGLLVDSEPLWTVAETELAAELGHPWSDELKVAVMGTRMEVAVPVILRWYGAEATPQRVAWASELLLTRMQALFARGLPVRDGVLDLLASVRAAGVPQALVSSSFRVLVDAVLAGLPSGSFDLTLAGDEVTRGKPDPEPYLTAAAWLGVPASRCVVLEDSLAGIAAGEAAGCRVVAVPDLTVVPAAPGRTVLRTLAGVTAADLGISGG